MIPWQVSLAPYSATHPFSLEVHNVSRVRHFVVLPSWTNGPYGKTRCEIVKGLCTTLLPLLYTYTLHGEMFVGALLSLRTISTDTLRKAPLCVQLDLVRNMHPRRRDGCQLVLSGRVN